MIKFSIGPYGYWSPTKKFDVKEGGGTQLYAIKLLSDAARALADIHNEFGYNLQFKSSERF